ncbi:MAG: S1/P1 nuclease [Cyclobacteriaceae bacterium]|nr:S1/P1 nuclease [Cyclobacteriaceae bacterium]
MRAVLFSCFLFFSIFSAHGWGQTGHRIVGQIAENHLSKKARKAILSILSGESLAEVSNYMDFIKSDTTYDYMQPWHYCTIPEGMAYVDAGVPPEGDIIQAIDRLIRELKEKQFSVEDEAFALKCLIHLVGDIHQPLHVGNGTDRGGNDVRLSFFGESTNLHRVWDSDMIDYQGFSYREYADWIDHSGPMDVRASQQQGMMEWVKESQDMHKTVYDLPVNKQLGYSYIYQNLNGINQRLLQAGLRLAGILNELYG